MEKTNDRFYRLSKATSISNGRNISYNGLEELVEKDTCVAINYNPACLSSVL